jgi:hypothetical protein
MKVIKKSLFPVLSTTSCDKEILVWKTQLDFSTPIGPYLFFLQNSFCPLFFRFDGFYKITKKRRYLWFGVSAKFLVSILWFGFRFPLTYEFYDRETGKTIWIWSLVGANTVCHWHLLCKLISFWIKIANQKRKMTE